MSACWPRLEACARKNGWWLRFHLERLPGLSMDLATLEVRLSPRQVERTWRVVGSDKVPADVREACARQMVEC